MLLNRKITTCWHLINSLPKKTVGLFFGHGVKSYKPVIAQTFISHLALRWEYALRVRPVCAVSL